MAMSEPTSEAMSYVIAVSAAHERKCGRPSEKKRSDPASDAPHSSVACEPEAAAPSSTGEGRAAGGCDATRARLPRWNGRRVPS